MLPLRNVLQEDQLIFPFCVLGIFQFAVFTLSVSRLLACLEQFGMLWALSQPGWLSFRTLNFRDLVWQRPVIVFQGKVLLQWD